MADLFPDNSLFDELEFLRFSDDQFASEIDNPQVGNFKETSLFTPPRATDSDIEGLSASPMLCTLTELKAAVASCTVGIYRSPEPDQNDANPMDCQEKTLNELVMNASDRHALNQTISCTETSTEEAVVTSPVSFSAVFKMSPDETSPGLIQSTEVSQTTSPLAVSAPSDGAPRKRKLKVCHTPGAKSETCHLERSCVASDGQKATKRKFSVTVDQPVDSAQFKSTKKTKKYQQKPYDDPEKERTRLNAINAKKNRDRKKYELQSMNQKCENLSHENKELDKTNRNLEARLHAAEEEIAFLRQALLGRVGPARPALDDSLKSLFGGNSAPAGG